MADDLRSRAETYAAGQYDARGSSCVHFGGDGAWHFSHRHESAAAARACAGERRAACVARILANGGHSEL